MITQDDITASAVLPDGTLVPLAVTDWSLILDGAYSPYAQGTLQCTVPANVDALDPRKRVRVQIELEQRYGSSTPLSALSGSFTGAQTLAAFSSRYTGRTLASVSADYGSPYNASPLPTVTRRFDLLLRERSNTHKDGVLTLELASDESLLQENRLLAYSPLNYAVTSVRSVVSSVLSRIGAVLATGTADAVIDTAAAVWPPAVSAWDFLAPLLEKAGLKLYCDENRVWRLVVPWTLGPSEVPGMLALNPILTEAVDTVSVDSEWYDGVIIKYQYKDYLGGEYLYWDFAGDNPTRSLYLEYSTYYPGPGAAANILRSIQNRGRKVISTAVSRFDVLPGQAMRLDLDGIPIQFGTVSAVEWTAGATMQVRSRDLVDVSDKAWQFASAKWNGVPLGTDWTEY